MLWLGVGGAIAHGQLRSIAQVIVLMNEDESGTLNPVSSMDIDSVVKALSGNQAWVDLIDPSNATRKNDRREFPGMSIVVHIPQVWSIDGVRDLRIGRPMIPLFFQSFWVSVASLGVAIWLWQLWVSRTVGMVDRAEMHMRSYASLDPLTGLLNRDGIRRRMKRTFMRMRENHDLAAIGARADARERLGVGVLLLDVDRFGLVNETLGQAAGDNLLRGMANRIRAVTRAGDGLARLSGDQFAIHVENVSGVEALIAMARNLRRALAEPHHLEGREVVSTVSIGIALAMTDKDLDSIDGLLYQATQAVRLSKKQGGNRFSVYEPANDSEDLRNRLDNEQRLHGALGAGQFFLLYQPIVDARSERMTMVEALLRWRDPDRGVISPVEFIPALEQTGLIVPVGRWVLHQACRQAATWPDSDDRRPIGISVNLSPLQFAEPDLLQMIEGVLKESGLAPGLLQLEVTEGLLLDPSPQTLRKIDALHALGVKLAIDDFWMGYSSLIYLKRFPLHALKIDRMFVRDIAERTQDLSIVRAIIDLGHGLGMRVTAEGVETRAQCEALARLECDSLQGYLFGRPSEVTQITVPRDGLPVIDTAVELAAESLTDQTVR